MLFRSGNGLGLAIVNALIIAHGGVASVRTAPDHGATFRIALPLAPEALGDEAADDLDDVDELADALESADAAERSEAADAAELAEAGAADASGATGPGEDVVRFGGKG